MLVYGCLWNSCFENLTPVNTSASAAYLNVHQQSVPGKNDKISERAWGQTHPSDLCLGFLARSNGTPVDWRRKLSVAAARTTTRFKTSSKKWDINKDTSSWWFLWIHNTDMIRLSQNTWHCPCILRFCILCNSQESQAHSALYILIWATHVAMARGGIASVGRQFIFTVMRSWKADFSPWFAQWFTRSHFMRLSCRLLKYCCTVINDRQIHSLAGIKKKRPVCRYLSRIKAQREERPYKQGILVTGIYTSQEFPRHWEELPTESSVRVFGTILAQWTFTLSLAPRNTLFNLDASIRVLGCWWNRVQGRCCE